MKEISEVLLTIRKATGISMLNSKRTILKEINVSFIVHFRLGMYSFSPDTFSIYFVFA